MLMTVNQSTWNNFRDKILKEVDCKCLFVYHICCPQALCYKMLGYAITRELRADLFIILQHYTEDLEL
jgi:hypothetical protein